MDSKHSPSIFHQFEREEDIVYEKVKSIPTETNSKKVPVNNPYLEDIDVDFLYHLGLDTSMNIKEMFSDVKFVCMGGSPVRAQRMAELAVQELKLSIPYGCGLVPLGKTERYSLYKVGPIISVSHGMGMPSLNILIHEITKLLHYAEATDVTYLRIGTCGGVGINPGTVVITSESINGELEPFYKLPILGKLVYRPTKLNPALCEEILKCREDLNVVIGKTLSVDCFYEGQGRLDGASCEYTEEDKMNFLRQLHDKGILNIEMESLAFAAFCNYMKISGAVLCVVLVNRLEADQVKSTPKELEILSGHALSLAFKFMRRRLGMQ